MADRRGRQRAGGWGLMGALAVLVACHSGGGTGHVSGGTGGGSPQGMGGGAGAAAGGIPGSGSGGNIAGTGGADAGAFPNDAIEEPPYNVRLEETCREAIIVQCERLNTCYGLASAPDACAQYADRCPSYYFNPRSLRTLESVAACIPMLKGATCTDILMGLGAQCLDHGTGGADAPCSSASECASGVCSGLVPTCGTCSPVAASGAACGGDAGYCGSGQICDPVSKTCVATPVIVAHAYLGGPCDLSADPPIGCVGDLFCVSSPDGGTAGTCAGLPGQGQPCANGSPQCASGLKCDISTDGGTRTAYCGDPAQCGNTTCAADSYCNETPTTPLHCVPYSKPGETCLWGVANADALCAPGSTCVGLVDVAGSDGGTKQGTCAVLQELGAPCDATNPCRDPFICLGGVCAQFDPETCLSAPADAGTD